ncbi:hypothetical protein J2X69_003882 [Algoriphagus sp. 4150]|nr:hypothetical protein [Algoriphagus sp. 4150]
MTEDPTQTGRTSAMLNVKSTGQVLVNTTIVALGKSKTFVSHEKTGNKSH